MAAFMLTLGSCVQDDLDNLQDQIDDLNEKVTLLESEQQAALQAEIAALEAEIADLQAKNNSQDAEIAAKYQEAMDALAALSNVVEDNDAAIYYGNLISEQEYADFVAQGASIVTGRVIVSSDDQAGQLSLLETVGGSLNVTGGSTVEIPLLKTVAGDLMISSTIDSATVSLPKLSIAGANLTVTARGVKSFTTPSLTFVADDLTIDVLDRSSNVVGALSTLDLAGASVNGNVLVAGTEGADIVLGSLGGSILLDKMVPGKLIAASETIGGDLSLTYVGGDFTELSFDNLTEVEGSFTFANNSYSAHADGTESGITALENVFSSLESIGGNVEINNNQFMVKLDDLNNVLTIGANNTGDTDVKVKTTSPEVSVFNAVVTVGSTMEDSRIWVDLGTEVASVFSNLTTAGDRWGNPNVSVTLLLKKYELFSEGGGGIGPFSVSGSTSSTTLDFDGFSKMTLVEELVIDAEGCEGLTATVTAFEEVTKVDHFNLNFSVEEGNFTFTGLNKLTKANGSSWDIERDNVLKVNKGHWNSDYSGGSNFKVTLDMFELLETLNYLTIEYKVAASGNYDLTLVHGLPAPSSQIKYGFKLVVGNNYASEPHRSMCDVPELKALTQAVFVDGAMPSYAVKMYKGMVSTNNQLTATTTPSIQDYLDILLVDCL